MKRQKLKVMVLMGGPSAEHEVSLHTGEQIKAHLDPRKYEVVCATIAKNGRWTIDAHGKDLKRSAPAFSGLNTPMIAGAALYHIAQQGIDVAFIALHGKFGEDGMIQGILDTLDIPYTGSGVLASALGMNKPRSLSVFRDVGFDVPQFSIFSTADIKYMSPREHKKIIKNFDLPLVVKPSDHGSSIGVSIVRNAKDLEQAIALAKKYSPEVIVQKFITGREVTCGVIEHKDGSVFALPPIEIIPRLGKFYDYDSKYADQGSDHLIPPRGMPQKRIAAIQKAAVHAHHVIGCSGMSRSDFILDKNGILHILEINTIPGMTSTSLLPQSAAHIGIGFPELLDRLIVSALKKKT